MTFLKRLRVLPVVLGVAATLAAVSSSLFGDVPGSTPAKTTDSTSADGGRISENLAINRFSKLPALTYQPRDGEVLFAWQVKPTVEAPPVRPRDVVVIVDCSASQAGRPMKQASQILSAYAATLNRNDRVSVWVASTPAATKPLTKGFFAPDADEIHDAATAITDVEYGSGATDLKNALNKATATFVPARGARQQLILFLGDGESAFNPVSEDDRLAIGNQMEDKQVYFFAVPLGLKVDPKNLHGFAAITGGAVVRLQEDLGQLAARNEFVTRLTAAIDAPVVKVNDFKFGEEVGEAYPTKLPPLRTDRTTLVMGKLAKPTVGGLSLTVNGKVAGRAVALNFSEKLPAPLLEHYFLNMMFEQWKAAPHKDAPAMLQSERALALADTQVKLYKDEFLVQAVWAITQSQWDAAAALYEATKKIDPKDEEAAAGLRLVEQLKSGKLTKQALEQSISAKVDALKMTPGATEAATRAAAARIVVQNVLQPEPPPGGAAGANPPNATDPLREAAARQQVEEQRYRVLVDATIRRARQLLRTDPDSAYADLKRQRDEILGYDLIGPAARTQMTADLEAVMREIFLKGAEIKRQAAAERAATANTRERLNAFDKQEDEEGRTKNRLDQFRQLMKQARFEQAYQEAQLMIQERITAGKSVPPSSVASYTIGQHATQLREWKELVRIREDRYLLTMMQTEKSHIPYPDEPPVHFPPAAVWRELTSLREEAYENSNLGPNPSDTQKQLKSLIENQEVLLSDNPNDTTNINDLPLMELLNKLSTRYKVTFVIMEDYFKADMFMGDIKEAKPKLASTQLRGLKLGTFLDIVLLSMNATYIVRPDYIEITTFSRRLEEKVTRVFPVADLVIPIPSSVNQATLMQNQQFQNNQLAIFGQVLGQQNFQGFGGAFGNQQGQGGGNNFNGQNAQGPGAGGPFGNGAAAIGNQGNLGFGAGGLGVTGGQLGQFGNLGGQFGLQGGDQSKLLMNLIVETVAKGEWAQAQKNNPAQPGMDDEVPALPANQLNSLGYYPPARALIIRGTSRYHPAATIKLKKPGDGGQAVGPMNPRNGGGAVVIAPGDPVKDPNPAAVAIAPEKEGLVNPKIDDVAERKKLGNDPKKMWNAAIARTVEDPGLIIASAEFLMEMDEYASAAEVLKGALRKGLTTDDWVHDSLAIALQASQASSDEIERAAVSGIDLDTTDSKAYLKAAKAEAGMKNNAQAVAFCKRAAEFAPDQPMVYANALAYAEGKNDVQTDAVVWAAHNLMRRDWNSSDGINYHEQVKARLPRLADQAEKFGQKADDIRKAVSEQTMRDLVIELKWQGAADLDLVIAEPDGSICSATQKRTAGGGVLKCDMLEQGNDRAEVYTASMAFKGTYTVTVKQAFGKPIGGTAQLNVWKNKGTPKESYDLITIDMTNLKPIEVKLESGSRTELATVYTEDDEFRGTTTGAALSTSPSGFGGGFGSLAAGPDATSGGPNLPVVNSGFEKRLPGIGSNASDLRASVKVNADRQSMTFHVNPVFGTGKAVSMPKVPLIPGGEDK